MAAIDSYGGKTLASRVHNTFDDHPEVKKEELHHFWLKEAHKPYPLQVTIKTRIFGSLIPRPPPFLPSVCVHNNTQEQKTSEKLGRPGSLHKGPTAKTTHKIICLSTSLCFRTPDLSVMETIRFDRKETHFQVQYVYWPSPPTSTSRPLT